MDRGREGGEIFPKAKKRRACSTGTMFLVDEGHKNSRGGAEGGAQEAWNVLVEQDMSRSCERPLGGGSVTRLTFLVNEVI
jgi:hypothetical protein